MARKSMTRLLVATGSRVLVVEDGGGPVRAAAGLGKELPGCLATLPGAGRAWCGTRDGGVFESEDGGSSWRPSGLAGRRVTALTVGPGDDGTVWAGTEPSVLWRTRGDGLAWERLDGLGDLPSSSEWAFPPRPHTHHVRWIACHPHDVGRLWVAVEAGALVHTPDGGGRWEDRVPGGPYDTHELAIHPEEPETLRVAAGDGYYESRDGGRTWLQPREGLEVGYLRSVAVCPGDPGVVVVSASSGPRSAYVAPRADGRLYRREGEGAWTRVEAGWPREPSTIAPIVVRGREGLELWAADERGVHHSDDGGVTWRAAASLEGMVDRVDALAVAAW